MTIGGAFTVAAGMVYEGEFMPIALLVWAAGTATFLAWLTVRNR